MTYSGFRTEAGRHSRLPMWRVTLAPHGADEDGMHLRLKAHFGQLVHPQLVISCLLIGLWLCRRRQQHDKR
jgi:hypothetical protein